MIEIKASTMIKQLETFDFGVLGNKETASIIIRNTITDEMFQSNLIEKLKNKTITKLDLDIDSSLKLVTRHGKGETHQKDM
jgi:hypothetical protein